LKSYINFKKSGEVEEEQQKSNIQRLFVLLPSIVEHQISLLKLSAAEFVVKGLNGFLTAIVLMLFGSFVILFLSISGAIWFGQLLNNMALGFLIMAMLYLVMMLLIIFILKPILTKSIFKSIIDSLDDEDEN
jgi:Putative Actinobacterial Holin-X, holin superfamily III